MLPLLASTETILGRKGHLGLMPTERALCTPRRESIRRPGLLTSRCLGSEKKLAICRITNFANLRSRNFSANVLRSQACHRRRILVQSRSSQLPRNCRWQAACGLPQGEPQRRAILRSVLHQRRLELWDEPKRLLRLSHLLSSSSTSSCSSLRNTGMTAYSLNLFLAGS
jgi:hypothetical protein